MNAAGQFVVASVEDVRDNPSPAPPDCFLALQGYTAGGNPAWSNSLHTVAGRSNLEPSVAIDVQGDGVLAYTQLLSTKVIPFPPFGSITEYVTTVSAEPFSARGVWGPVFVATAPTGSASAANIYHPSVAIDSAGNYVVAYTYGGDDSLGAVDGGSPSVTAWAVGASGAPIGGVNLASEAGSGLVLQDDLASVAMSSSGHLVAAWQDLGRTYVGELPHDNVFTQPFQTASYTITVNQAAATPLGIYPGTSGTVTVTINRDPGFTGAISLSLSGLQSGVTATISAANPADPATETRTVTFTASASAPSNANGSVDLVTVTATSPGQPNQASLALIQILASSIDTVSPSVVNAPQMLQAGTLVTLIGHGFTPGSVVQFGDASKSDPTDDPNLQATPTWISADGTSLTVNVPLRAMSGQVTVVRADGSTIVSTTALTVNSFRNTDGFSFGNIPFDATLQNFSDEFGYASTHVSADGAAAEIGGAIAGPAGAVVGLLLGWGAKAVGIDPATPVYSPFVDVLAGIASDFSSQGACFGMDVSIQQFLDNPSWISSTFGLPAGAAPTIHNLVNNQALTDHIHQAFVSQFSAEGLHDFLSWEAGSHDQTSVYNSIATLLQSGDHPIISMQDGGEGHAVLAYDLEGTANDFYIDVYDPNRPDTSTDEMNASNHVADELASRIHVVGNTWNFVHGHDIEANRPSPDWTGGFGSLQVFPASDFTSTPTLPNPTDLAALKTIIFGGSLPTTPAVLNDGAGDLTIDAFDATNTQPNTLSIAAAAGGGLTLTINGKAYSYLAGQVKSLTFAGGATHDTIAVDSLPAGTSLTMYLGTGGDTVNLGAAARSLGSIQGRCRSLVAPAPTRSASTTRPTPARGRTRSASRAWPAPTRRRFNSR